MSVANRYKLLTISGSHCFALLRSMATRETHLRSRLSEAILNSESLELIEYIEGQLTDLNGIRAILNDTPFQDGRPS